MVIVYALISISVIVFMLWILGFLLKWRYQRRRLNQSAPQEAGIARESVEVFYPSTRLNKLWTEGDQKLMCMICLEDFASDSKVRKLRCTHIFHADCIDE